MRQHLNDNPGAPIHATTLNAAPPVTTNDQGHMKSWKVPSPSSNITTAARGGQVPEPPHLTELRRAAEIAKHEGDPEGYLLGRQLLLLCQSALSQAGELRR